MIHNLKKAIEQIDEIMVRTWVEDLIFNKTSEGLIIQEIILKEISQRLHTKATGLHQWKKKAKISMDLLEKYRFK